MARLLRSTSPWGIRMVEWGILALVVLGFAWALGWYAQRVHAQAERAAVLSTLGAVRTSFVLGRLQTEVQGAPSSTAAANAGNPFDQLERYPAYGGEVRGRDVGAVAAGQWVFDVQCDCIGYKPLYLDALESSERLEALWFQRRGSGRSTFLVPMDRYVWQGQLVE